MPVRASTWEHVRVNTHILLVEDDDGIRTLVSMALEDAGYAVTACASAEEALIAFGRQAPDLLLVDLMLGAIDGFVFLAEVRRHTRAPVIVLSALKETDHIVQALELGADDYVTKPFKEAELLARVRALLRRSEGPDVATPDMANLDTLNPEARVPSATAEPLPGSAAQGPPERSALLSPPEQPPVVLDPDGPLVLDRAAGVVRRGADEIPLTVTEFRLLCDMAAAAGRVLSRELLLERVWSHDYFGDQRLVDVHVRRLRTKIERDPGNPTIVVTIRGQGYRLDLP